MKSNENYSRLREDHPQELVNLIWQKHHYHRVISIITAIVVIGLILKKQTLEVQLLTQYCPSMGQELKSFLTYPPPF